jgi:hypothetical protein
MQYIVGDFVLYKNEVKEILFINHQMAEYLIEDLDGWDPKMVNSLFPFEEKMMQIIDFDKKYSWVKDSQLTPSKVFRKDIFII